MAERRAADNRRLSGEIDDSREADGNKHYGRYEIEKDLFKFNGKIKIAPAPLDGRPDRIVVETSREVHVDEIADRSVTDETERGLCRFVRS